MDISVKTGQQIYTFTVYVYFICHAEEHTFSTTAKMRTRNQQDRDEGRHFSYVFFIQE